MMKVASLMNEYFEPVGRSLNEAPGPELPVTVKKKKWTHTENPDALRRLFEFDTVGQLINFLEDLLQMQDEMGHYGKLLIEKNTVIAHVSTTVLQRVTDLDVEWAAKVDEIYEDAKDSTR